MPQLSLLLAQTAPGKAQLYARIGGRTARAVMAYATVDESGLIPRVTELWMHGILPGSGRAISERFGVAGGEIR